MFKKLLVLCLMFVAGIFMVGCGKEELNFGKELLKIDSQLDVLTQLNNGTVDVGVIDSVMAGYYTNTGDFKDKLVVVDDLVLATEEYGVAGRKNDVELISKVNEAIIALANTGYKAIAEEFGLIDSTCVNSDTKNPLATEADGSWEKIANDKKVVIGYTVFAPISWEKDGELTGFDVKLAKNVFEYLNEKYNTEITIEFKIIDWNSKETLLSNGTIDLIWNGMTINEERKAAMCISIPYLKNKQVAVVKAEDKDNYKTLDSMIEAIIGVEGGSAGEDVVVKK